MKNVLMFFGALVAGIALGYLLFWLMQGNTGTFSPTQSGSSAFDSTHIKTEQTQQGSFSTQSSFTSKPFVIEK